jgi:DNA invertase Pin-like site-specific DNA recombinase
MLDSVTLPPPVAHSPLLRECATPVRPPLTVGYARALSPGPALDAQARALEARGCHRIYRDVASGAATIRPGLDDALSSLQPGDLLAVASLALLSWRLDGLWPVLAAVEAAGADLLAEAEGFDTRSVGSTFAFARILDAYAGTIRAARRAEATAHRPDSRCRIEEGRWQEVEPLMAAGQLSVAEGARRLGVNRSTVYRRLEACP